MSVRNFWLVLIVCLALTSTAHANAMKGPNKTVGPIFHGEINGALIDESDGDDAHFQARELILGAKGIYVPEGLKFKLAWAIDLNFADAANTDKGKNDVEVENAHLIFLTKYGKFIGQLRGQSKVHDELLGAVDQFELWTPERDGGLFDQPDVTGAGLIYNTHYYKGFYFGIGNVSLDSRFDDNDQDLDAWGGRIMYRNKVGNGILRAGVGYNHTSGEVINAATGGAFDDEYYNYMLTAQYLWDAGHNISSSYECVNDHPFGGDFGTLGIVAKAQLTPEISFTAGYYTQDGDKDGQVIAANVTYQMTKQLSFYGEFVDSDDVRGFGNNAMDVGLTGLGMKFTF